MRFFISKLFWQGIKDMSNLIDLARKETIGSETIDIYTVHQ